MYETYRTPPMKFSAQKLAAKLSIWCQVRCNCLNETDFSKIFVVNLFKNAPVYNQVFAKENKRVSKHKYTPKEG